MGKRGKYFETQDLDILEIAARLTPEWLAGFFDGEGSICGANQGTYPTLQVYVCQSEPKIISAIALKFPKGARVYSVMHKKLSRKPCYYVRWYGRYALPFLETIKDHVIVKRSLVFAGIELANMVVDKPVGYALVGPGITSEEVEQRKALAEKMRALNHGG